MIDYQIKNGAPRPPPENLEQRKQYLRSQLSGFPEYRFEANGTNRITYTIIRDQTILRKEDYVCVKATPESIHLKGSTDSMEVRFTGNDKVDITPDYPPVPWPYLKSSK